MAPGRFPLIHPAQSRSTTSIVQALESAKGFRFALPLVMQLVGVSMLQKWTSRQVLRAPKELT